VYNKMKMQTKFLISLTAFALFAAGCSSNKPDSIVTLNDKNLYLQDFLYDIYDVETEGNNLELYFQEHLGYSYWDYDYEGSTMREIAKNSILARVVMYEILSDQATKKGVTLTQTERSEDEDKVKDIIKSTSEQALNDVGITHDILLTSIDKISLGDKYRSFLLTDYKIDEAAIRKNIKKDDYREYQTECLFIPTAKLVKDSLMPLSKAEVDQAHDTITKVAEDLSDGEGFDSLLNEFSSLKYSTRNFIKGDSSIEEEYQSASLLLQNNEYSPVIETNYGYYIIHMQDNNSTEQYEKEVQTEINAKEDEYFTSIYTKLKNQYDITINFDYWDKLTIGSITTAKD